MANEIIGMEQSADGKTITVAFLFPITSPRKVGGSNVVPTPSNALPPTLGAALTPAERAALDAGTLVYEMRSFQRGGVSGGQLLDRIQTIYASRLTRAQAEYVQRYRFSGRRFDAA